MNGSWTRSAQPAVEVTRGTHAGHATHRAAKRRRPLHDAAVSAMVVCSLVLMAAANLIDVYGSPVAWGAACIPATTLGALTACAGRNGARPHTVPRIAILLVGQFAIGPVIAFHGSAVGHVLPSPDTLRQGWYGTFGAFPYLVAVAPPIGTGHGSLMAAWTLCLWTSYAACALAAAPRRRANALCALPLAVLTSACALLGTASGFRRTSAGITGAFVLVIWLSWRWRLVRPAPRASAVVAAVVAVVLAAGCCMALTPHRLTIRDRYEPPISLNDIASPLSGMRSYVRYHKDDVLLTATGLPAGTPVRMAVMDHFDGTVWNLSDRAETDGSADYRPVGESIPTTARGEPFTAKFRLAASAAGHWLPLAGTATGVTFDGDARKRGTLENELYYNTGTASAILTAPAAEDISYTETGVIEQRPSDARIGRAAADHIAQPRAQDVPDAVARMALAVAGGDEDGAAGGRAAQSLSAMLREHGWFSHGLAGEYPSPPGHGSYRVDMLLSGPVMVGDSEQYASAMALMAREIGLPSRVVLGFLPKDEHGGISRRRTVVDAEGTPVTEFRGGDIEAWVEIKLKGCGWVMFRPTPSETDMPDPDQSPAPPDPQPLVRQPPVPLDDPLRDRDRPYGQAKVAGQDADMRTANPMWTRLGRIAGGVARYGSPVWACACVCAAILAAKACIMARWRRRGDPRRRIVSGWRSVEALALQGGIAITGTRRNQAGAIAAGFGITASFMARLARTADYAAFAGRPMSDARANAYWDDVRRLHRMILSSQPPLRRWRTRLSLRGIRRPPQAASSERRRDRGRFRISQRLPRMREPP